MRRDGTVVEVLPDGTERPFPDTPMRPMTEAEVQAAALADPDAQPLTEEKLARMKPVPRAKTLRRALGLTQEEFAARYHIPIGTLRDWEQGRSELDQPARAYLKVNAGDPEGVRRALEAGPKPRPSSPCSRPMSARILCKLASSMRPPAKAWSSSASFARTSLPSVTAVFRISSKSARVRLR
jgi:putative transcriptional regulator